MAKKRVLVVGAGPGGLTAAMILASKGYDVQVFERQPSVGGRNAGLRLAGGFTFDLGPTFLVLKPVLEEVFALAGRRLEDYLELRSIDPFYRLVLGDGRELRPTADRVRMKEQLDALFPGSWEAYVRHLEREARKIERLRPCLRSPARRLADLATLRFARALPVLDAHRSLMSQLGRTFADERLRLALTFQTRYLGISPWRCPATFSFLASAEPSGGVHHPIGGLSQISKAMAEVIAEERGQIHLATGVAEVVVEGGRATGVRLENGRLERGDHVVLGADLGTVGRLVGSNHLGRWPPARLERCELSSSAFALYLGVGTIYEELPHHSVVLPADYRRNMAEVTERLVVPEDPSFFVRNASVTDPTLAPSGKSAIQVLVPVPNNRSGIDWAREKAPLRDRVLDLCETRGGMPDLRRHIEVEQVVTPADWESAHGLHRGATFGLAPTATQMLVGRPPNRFEGIEGCYLVGADTHPGGGLPGVFESARISAGLILRQDAWYLS